MLLEPDDAPDQAKLDVARTLIHCSNLPHELKKWCGRQLE